MSVRSSYLSPSYFLEFPFPTARGPRERKGSSATRKNQCAGDERMRRCTRVQAAVCYVTLINPGLARVIGGIIQAAVFPIRFWFIALLCLKHHRLHNSVGQSGCVVA